MELWVQRILRLIKSELSPHDSFVMSAVDTGESCICFPRSCPDLAGAIVRNQAKWSQIPSSRPNAKEAGGPAG